LKIEPVSPRKTPKQGRSKTLVDAVLTAAARILSSTGFDKSNTNRIAELAGVSIGSLYQYFPNKDALVGALLDHQVDAHVKIVETKLAEIQEPSVEKIVDLLLDEILGAVINDRKLLRVICEQVFRVGRLSMIISGRKQLIAMILRVLQENAKKVKVKDGQLAAYVMVNATGGIIDTLIFDDDKDDDQRWAVINETKNMLKGYLLSDQA
jgi:AcrR family transcriptional regulator